MTKNRVQYIDRLKGVAILAVIVSHTTIWTFNHPNDPISYVMASFMMPVFMFLSGVVVSAPPNLGKLIKKTIALVLPALSIGLTYSLSFGKSAFEFFWYSTKYGYWYLFVLAIFYCILACFNWNKELKGRQGLLIDALQITVIYVILLAMKFLLPSRINGLLSTDQCVALFYAFMGGYLVRKYNMLDYFMQHNWIFSISLILYAAFSALYIGGFRHLYMPAGLFSVPTFIYLFRSREHKQSLIEDGLAFVGRRSLDVYIYHYFFIHLIFLAAFGEWVIKTGNYFIELIVCIFIAIGIAIICILTGYVVRLSNLLNNVIYGKFMELVIK